MTAERRMESVPWVQEAKESPKGVPIDGLPLWTGFVLTHGYFICHICDPKRVVKSEDRDAHRKKMHGYGRPPAL